MDGYMEVDLRLRASAGEAADAALNRIIEICKQSRSTRQFRASIAAYLAVSIIEILKQDS